VVVIAIGMAIGCVPIYLVQTLPWSPDEFDTSVTSAAMTGPMGIFFQCIILVLGVLTIIGGQHLTRNAGTVKVNMDDEEDLFS
jgi:hypothetical protein